MRIFFIASVFALISQQAAAGQLWLTMDQVRPFKPEKPVHSIVVGNPSIADVNVQGFDQLLFFGKAPGMTNVYFFDENGEAIENLIVRVRTPSSDMLTVHRGAARTTYNCTTNCEATITVGDDQTVFQGVAAQVQNKYSQAQTAASAQGGSGPQ